MVPITETNPTSTPTKRTNYLVLLYGVLGAAILFLTLGPLFSARDPLWGVVLTELVAIGLPAIYWRKRQRIKEREAMTLKEAAILTLALFPVILVINGLFLEGLNQLLPLENQNLDILKSNGSLLKQLITLAIIPAFFEELFFRSVICEQFARRSPMGSVIFSAVLFALFHFQWQNSMAPFLFGLVLGYIYLYGGLKASVFSHFLYNFCSILFVRSFSESWMKTFGDLTLVRGMGGVKNVMTLLLLVGSALGIFIILRQSFKRPLPKKGPVVRGKEWIPVAGLVLVYVIKTFA